MVSPRRVDITFENWIVKNSVRHGTRKATGYTTIVGLKKSVVIRNYHVYRHRHRRRRVYADEQKEEEEEEGEKIRNRVLADEFYCRNNRFRNES